MSLLNPVTCFLDSTAGPHMCPHYVVILVDLTYYSSNLLNCFFDTIICFFFPTHSPPLNIFPVFHGSHWWTYWLTPGLKERERKRERASPGHLHSRWLINYPFWIWLLNQCLIHLLKLIIHLYFSCFVHKDNTRNLVGGIWDFRRSPSLAFPWTTILVILRRNKISLTWLELFVVVVVIVNF